MNKFSSVAYIWMCLHVTDSENNDILFAYRKIVVKD